MELKRSLFSLLRDFDTDAAASLYNGIIKELKEKFPGCAISVFTTNYDLTFEESQDALEDTYKVFGIEDVDYGFTSLFQRYVYNPKKVYTWSESVIEYKKLHGSLDWSVSQRGVVRGGNIVSPSNLEEMLLLYPGFKGVPKSEPYKNLHDDLLQRLLDADLVYVIGFAFRDEYINNQFETALKINKSLQIFCINPADLSKLPDESKLHEFVANFSGKFHHVQAGIEAGKTNPLGIVMSGKSATVS